MKGDSRANAQKMTLREGVERYESLTMPNPCGVECRILSIVDAFDIIINDRPYRKAKTKEEAIAELKRCAGSQCDPHLVEKFIWIVNRED